MTVNVDFVLEAPDQASLLVEAKATDAPSDVWAVSLVRNLLAHADVPPNPAVLLVLRNNCYFWNRVPSPGDAPELEEKTENVLRPYLANLRTSLRDLTNSGFETVVRMMLDDLVDGTNTEPWVLKAGLDRFRHARLKVEQTD